MEQAATSAAPSAPVTEAPVTNETPTLENTAEEVIAEGEAAKVEAEAQSEAKEAAQKFKRKVNGKLVEASEDELWKHYGLESTSRERMQEAAKQKKEADELRKAAQQDKDALGEFLLSLQKKPDTVFQLLEKMGHDPKAVARQLVLREMELERMSPEQRRIHDLEQEREQWLEEQKLRKEALEAEEKNKQDAHFIKSVDDNLSEALKLSGLTPKPKTIARMAEACQTLLNAMPPNSDLPSPDKVVQKFLSHMRQDASDLIGEQSPEKLVELGILTDKSIKQIVDWHLAKNKTNLPSFESGQKQVSNSKKEPKKKIGINQFFDNL